MLYFISPHRELIQSINTTSIEHVLNELQKHCLIAFDTETTGLSPYKDRVVLMQFGTPTDQFVIDTRANIAPSIFKPILEDPAKTFIIHNAKFDYNMLKQYNIIISNIYCTRAAEVVLMNGKYGDDEIKKLHPFSLKECYKRYFDVEIDKEAQTSFIKHVGPFTLTQVNYAANDVIFARQIYEKQQPKIDMLELKNCVNLENESALAFADMEYNGIRVDVDKWRALAISNGKKLTKAQEELDKELFSQEHSKISKYIVTSWQKDLFNQDWEPRKCNVNWSSSAQVLKVLKDVYNIVPVDKHGKISSDEVALSYLHNPPAIVNKLLKYREACKQITTYGEDFLRDHLHEDGKIHTTFDLIKSTGRVSSYDPNLQNIPYKDTKEFRYCFVADEGYSFIVADYSAQEPRCTADKCGDKKLIDFFLHGHGDIHTMTTSQMWSIITGEKVDIPPKIEDDPEALAKHNAHPYAKFRPIGKQCGLKLDYGGTAYTFKHVLNCSEEEAQRFIDAYWSAFPNKREYFKKCARFVLKHGYIRTNDVTNRIRYFKEHKRFLELEKRQEKEKLCKEEYRELMMLRNGMERQAGNTTIQGTCGDMTKTAIVFMRKELKQYGDSVKLILQVHDEIIVMSKTEIAQDIANIVKDCMTRAGNVYCKRVPMKMDPHVSTRWEK